jgi:hypothetical protein
VAVTKPLSDQEYRCVVGTRVSADQIGSCFPGCGGSAISLTALHYPGSLVRAAEWIDICGIEEGNACFGRCIKDQERSGLVALQAEGHRAEA